VNLPQTLGAISQALEATIADLQASDTGPQPTPPAIKSAFSNAVEAMARLNTARRLVAELKTAQGCSYRLAAATLAADGCPHCGQPAAPLAGGIPAAFCIPCRNRMPEGLQLLTARREAAPKDNYAPHQCEDAHNRALDLALAWLRVNAKERQQ